MNILPRGLTAASIQNRFAGSAPQPRSYDAASHSVEAVISMGSPVVRSYGTEVLRISPDAVDLSRMQNSGIPVLDSHKQGSILSNHLGRVQRTWFRDGALEDLRANQSALEPGGLGFLCWVR